VVIANVKVNGAQRRTTGDDDTGQIGSLLMITKHLFFLFLKSTFSNQKRKKKKMSEDKKK
jgi:hypothetical protein